VCVNVDEARRDDEALGVYFGFGGAINASDLRNSTVFDREIGEKGWVTGTVDDAAMADDYVERLGIYRRSCDKAEKAKEQAKISIHRASYTFVREEKR
jgi:hypothetical protein